MTKLVPFDTSKSPRLESGEWVRVKDQTDANYDREGAVTDRTIYGGTVHFEDCDVRYRNDQLERLGQRKTVVWRLTSAGPHNGTYVPYRLQRDDKTIAGSISFPIAEAVLDRLMRPGDTYIETGDVGDPWIATYDQRKASRKKTRRWLAGDPDDDDTQPTEDDDDQDLEPIDNIFAPPVPADWYPS